VIDADARSAEVWTPADPFPHMEHDALVWTPEGASAPLEISLAELFRAV